MSERVTIKISAGVADVRLNRPDKMNGLDLAMFEGLINAGRGLSEDPSVRAVVLSGVGRCFCAGLDWKHFLSLGEGVKALLERRAESPANMAQRVGWIWREVPVPVIAAVHGVAFGGGLQIAAGCDLRFVARDAELSVMEIKYGLIPDMGISKTLLPSVRLDIAKELAFTGRVVSGEQAVHLGLATRACDDPLAEALETARRIASRSPDAIRRVKRLFDAAGDLNVADALAMETSLQMELLGTANQMEAVQAAMTQREPTFTDPK